MIVSDVAQVTTPEDLYLDLLKRCLTRLGFGETYHQVEPPRGTLVWPLFALARALFRTRDLRLVQRFPAEMRAEGQDWPLDAETMIGLKRLDHLQACIVDVLRSHTPGDLIETGVWRGGATILMRAVLRAYGDEDRTVWVADSFAGLPHPSNDAPASDRHERLWAFSQLAVPVGQVRQNFARYGLLDQQVRFLEGWFKDTLPVAPIERLAVLRLDGDLYESTKVALDHLYPRLSVGGYAIVDDYGAVPGCRQAVDEYRAAHGVTDAIERVDDTCVFWKRS